MRQLSIFLTVLLTGGALCSYVFEAYALEKEAEYEKSLLPQMPKGPETDEEKAVCERALFEKKRSVCGGNCTIPRDNLMFLNCVFKPTDEKFKVMCCPSPAPSSSSSPAPAPSNETDTN